MNKLANHYLKRNDYNELIESLNKNSIFSFIDKYISKHSQLSLTRKDVVSLALYQTVSDKKEELCEKLLNFTEDGTELTSANFFEFSPLSLILVFYSNNIQIAEIFKNHIALHKNNTHKASLEGREFVLIKSALEKPLPIYESYEENFNYIYKNFLEPLYTHTSLEKLAEELNFSFPKNKENNINPSEKLKRKIDTEGFADSILSKRNNRTGHGQIVN